MSTPDFIHRHLNQDLVYWKVSGNDGEGGFEYEDPIEIKGRCEYKEVQVLTAGGETKVSRAQAFLDRAVKAGDYLYLGTLADSTIGNDQEPETTEGSMRVLVMGSVPSLDGSGYLYKAYLNMA